MVCYHWLEREGSASSSDVTMMLFASENCWSLKRHQTYLKTSMLFLKFIYQLYLYVLMFFCIGLQGVFEMYFVGLNTSFKTCECHCNKQHWWPADRFLTENNTYICMQMTSLRHHHLTQNPHTPATSSRLCQECDGCKILKIGQCLPIIFHFNTGGRFFSVHSAEASTLFILV
jgi:hypothetical protein